MANKSRSIADHLRFESAITATNLALRKWAQLGHGVNAAGDPELRDFAAKVTAELAELMRRNGRFER